MKFELKISAEELSRGLRPSKRAPRNSKFAVECLGATGVNNVLTALPNVIRMATAEITDSFPYPQIFVFREVIIVCSATKVFEWIDNTLIEKISVDAGTPWRAADFGEYIYLSNGAQAVTRSFGYYEVSASLPSARAVCDMNGQLIVGGIL